MAIISACDDCASSVCRQLGRDHGDESFSGFEFRYNLHSDCELRCHLLHERCPEIADRWPDGADRMAKLVSHFFDLDTGASPVIVIALSWQHSNEQVLSQIIVPVICDNFPGVPIIAIQCDAFSSRPSECLRDVPLVQCISHAGQSIPVTVLPVLANLFHACYCSRQQGTLLQAESDLFVGSSLPVVIQQKLPAPTSPVFSAGNGHLESSASTKYSQVSGSSLRAATLTALDDIQSGSASPLASEAASNATLGLSLKWSSDGLTVQSLVPDSFAGRCGFFQAGDLILDVDGIDVASSRSSRYEAIARLRQSCDAPPNAPVLVCTRAGPGWHGDSSRLIGSVNLFQLSRSSASAPEPAAVPQASFHKNVAENGDLNSIFIQARPSAPEPAAVPQASFDKNVAENGDLNSIFIQARQCHLNGDSVAASTHLLNAARRNHPPACAMLASFYLNGWGGLPQNYQLAFFLARWSALQKDPDGLGILACCYMFRLGTVQDLALAHTLAVGCANASPHGQFCLGYMHRHGLVVDKDAALAAR